MVTVRVTPINKHAPSFMFPNYNIFFAENETNGSSVYQVEAVDEDEGIFGEIDYSIRSDLARSLFEIVSDTGMVFVKSTGICFTCIDRSTVSLRIQLSSIKV